MFSKLNWVVLVIMLTSLTVMWKKNEKLTREKDRYRENSHALMGEIKRIQVDSTTMALEVHSLRLTRQEYEMYRAEDAEMIKTLGIRIRDLEAAAKHRLSVNVPIEAPFRDSVIIRDTVFIAVQTVEMDTPYVQMKGMIENHIFTADLHLPVTLNQAVWVEYQRKFPWLRRRVKAVHQTISSDNPHVEVEYSEYINIGK